MDHSVASLEVKANVCCVKFNPESRYHLAFGSAGVCASVSFTDSLWIVSVAYPIAFAMFSLGNDQMDIFH